MVGPARFFESETHTKGVLSLGLTQNSHSVDPSQNGQNNPLYSIVGNVGHGEVDVVGEFLVGCPTIIVGK